YCWLTQSSLAHELSTAEYEALRFLCQHGKHPATYLCRLPEVLLSALLGERREGRGRSGIAKTYPAVKVRETVLGPELQARNGDVVAMVFSAFTIADGDSLSGGPSREISASARYGCSSSESSR